MANNYQKFGFDSLKQKIQSGGYSSYVGASRGVGKAATLTEAEREKLKAIAREHFGVTDTPDPAGKAPVKRATKKAAAAATRGPAVPKPERKPREKKLKPERAPREKKLKPARLQQLPLPLPGLDTPTPEGIRNSPVDARKLAGEVVGTADQALRVLAAAREMFPDAAQLETAVADIVKVTQRGIRLMERYALSPVDPTGGAPVAVAESVSAPVVVNHTLLAEVSRVAPSSVMNGHRERATAPSASTSS